MDKINTQEIWLNYFNKVLFENRVITEKEKNKINILIKSHCSPSKTKVS